MEAENCVAAVEKLMRQDFNLFLTDLNMPELYGDRVIRAVGWLGTQETNVDYRHPRPKVRSMTGCEVWFGVRMGT